MTIAVVEILSVFVWRFIFSMLADDHRNKNYLLNLKYKCWWNNLLNQNRVTLWYRLVVSQMVVLSRPRLLFSSYGGSFIKESTLQVLSRINSQGFTVTGSPLGSPSLPTAVDQLYYRLYSGVNRYSFACNQTNYETNLLLLFNQCVTVSKKPQNKCFNFTTMKYLDKTIIKIRILQT